MDLQLNLQNGLMACTGAEVNICADGTFDIRLVKLSMQKKLINIDEKKVYAITLDQFKTIQIPGALAVTFTGKGVLIKKTNRLESLSDQNLRPLFPGFKRDEFYLQHFQSGAFSYITFIRKEIADPVLQALKKQGAAILMLSLGPFAVEHVVPLLNNYQEEIHFDGHQLSLNTAKEWLDYQYLTGSKSSFVLKIDLEPIEQHFLLAYAAAFQLLLNDRLDLIEVEIEAFQNDLTEALAKLKFNKYGAIVLVIFFVLLLLNFLLFSFYHADNQELTGKVGERSDLFSDRQRLTSEIKDNELQVKQVGWNHGYRYAYLCDQIGQTVPAAILLQEMMINSIRDNTSGATQKVGLATGSIRIIGTSASMYLINDWLYALKQKSWVKAVKLERYATDDQKGVQVFTILLTY
jgi:hypothetical protein